MRKKQKSNGINQKTSSNAQRSSNARRKRNQGRFAYELAQFHYHNRRKALVRKIMDTDNPKQCPIKLDEIEENFNQILGTPNNLVRETYSLPDPNKNLREVSLPAVKQAIKGMSLDTSPGPDRILMRTIKELGISEIIQVIINIMLLTSYVPEKT